MTISVSLGLWKPHVQTAVQRLNSLYPTTSLGTYLGHDPDRSLAVDLMIPSYKTAAGKSLGWAVAKFIWENRIALGVHYVIFDRQIISRTAGKGYWKTYYPTERAIKASPDSAYHYNHVHVSFYGETPPGWSNVADLGDVWLDLLVPGVEDSKSVRLVQKALGIEETGNYDAATVAAVQAFQASLGDDPEHCDGLLGRTQANALFTAKKMSVTIRTDPSGAAPKAPEDVTPGPVPPVVTPPVVTVPPVKLPTYTVKAGDTLADIASRIDITWQALASLNPGINPNVIRAGQVLTVPKAVPAPVVVKPPVVKPPVVIKPDTTPKPTTPEVPVSTATETIFGLNILRRTDTLAGRKRWPERKPLIGKILRDAKASVYLLIETDTQTRKDCGEALGSNFTWWGFKYYGVYWDQRVWERVGDATNQVELRDRNNRWLLSLPLRHKATGKVVTFDCTHLENDGDTRTDGHKSRAIAAGHMADVAGRGDRVGFWDCNSTTPAIVSKPTPRELEKPRVILRNRIGARFLTSLGSSKVKNLSKGTHHGGKGNTSGPLIDDAWVVGDVEILDGEVVLTHTTDATDHNGLKFRIKFKK